MVLHSLLLLLLDFLCLLLHLLNLFFAQHVNGHVHKVANNGIHVAANISNLSKFGGFNFYEWRFGELGQAARDFGFAHARGTDH